MMSNGVSPLIIRVTISPYVSMVLFILCVRQSSHFLFSSSRSQIGETVMVEPGVDENKARAKSYTHEPAQSPNSLANSCW